MELPELDQGFLPPGLYFSDLDEIKSRFCIQSDTRIEVGRSIDSVIKAGRDNGALYAIFGGSFVSGKLIPGDVDLILVYRDKKSIPNKHIDIFSSVVFDIQFASEDEPEILSSYLGMFGRGRDALTVGVLVVSILGDGQRLKSLAPPNADHLDVLIALYGLRHMTTPRRRRGLLITMHGIKSTAPWNSEVTQVFSSSGWIVAPFIYGYQKSWILLSRRKRQDVLDRFRDWLDRVVTEEGLRDKYIPVSVIAHSLGTFILFKYLVGFQNTPYSFNGVILTGCILRRKLDWSMVRGKVVRVLNEVAPNDKAARRAWALRSISFSELFGSAGARGFIEAPNFVVEDKSSAFTHTNAISKDVIRTRWLPFMNSLL
jgi:hypothetical protein